MRLGALVPNLYRPWRNPVAPTFEDFVSELALLGLKGVHFTAERYAEALAGYLGLPVQVGTITDYVSLNSASLEARALRRELATTGHMGATKLIEGDAGFSFRVVYLDDLNWWLKEHTLFHELAHVAAGHFRDVPSAPRRKRRHVPKLADRPPVQGHELQEREADLRANYALLAGSLGELSLRKGSLTRLA